MLAAVAGQAGEEADEDFNQTVLLLHGDGTNGAQNNTFLDSSTNNFTITRNGNTTQGTFSPFSVGAGEWSNYFDGTDDYLSVADNAVLRPGAGAFTLEAWIYRNASGAAHTIYAKGGASTGIVFQVTSGNVLRFTHTTTNIDSTGTIAANTWTHVAVVREGTGSNQTKLYINGTNDGQGTVSTDFTQTEEVRIGTNRGATDDFAGYISNVRFVKGSALYTTTFTPSTSPLTTTSQGASSSEVELLTCQANRFVDNSTNAFAITRNGDVRVTPFSPFAPSAAYDPAVNGGSGYWDGTGDSLSSTTDFEASTSTSTFTIEGWIYPTTFSQLINIIGGMVVSSGDQKSIAAEVNTSGQVALYWFDGAIKRCTGDSVMQLYAWNYFAIVVNSNAIAIYVNKTTADTLSGTTTLTNRTQLVDLGVGRYQNLFTPQTLNGYLSSIRVSTVARTISSVPTAPFTSDADVRWLLNFTNAGIFDNTGKNVLETVGNAQIDTTTKKYGTGSLEFDGTGDWLLMANTPDQQLGTGNFTIEFWVYLASGDTGSARGLVAKGTSTTGWLVSLDSSEKVVFTYTTSTITSSGAITTNAWNHIAVVRSGTGSNQTKIYIGGTNDGTGTVSTDFNQTSVMYVGANRTGGDPMKGYIDDLRITKGVARYTANFTVPGKAFSNL
jgi:hypothetical protein